MLVIHLELLDTISDNFSNKVRNNDKMVLSNIMDIVAKASMFESFFKHVEMNNTAARMITTTY